jgi:hypothetical protein
VAVGLSLVLAGCTSLTTRESPLESASSSAPSASPSVPVPDIRFALDNTYLVGDRVVVKIENIGDVSYEYQFTYQACFLSYFDSHGRKFIIPPGTHCDILGRAAIKPGETKRLFTWDLDECIKDVWGCQKSRPLRPGTYTIRGIFQQAGEGAPARAEATFEIQPSY